MPPDQTDAQIIERSLHTPELFGSIFDRHVDDIHRYLNRRAGRDNADGLVGDVFRIAFENRARYLTERDSALPWLYGIAANVLRQHARGEHRRRRLIDKVGAATVLFPVHRDDGDRLHGWQELDAVLDALEQLPAVEREAVLLFAWEDLTYEAIAVAQDVPVGTVRSRLNRARGRIRELVGDERQEDDETIRRAARRCQS